MTDTITPTVAALQVNQRLRDVKLLVETCVERETSRHTPYLALTLRDQTGSINGKFWDASADAFPWAEPGRVVIVSGRVESYQDKLQLNVEGLDGCDDPPSIFLPRSIREPSEMFDELRAIALSELCPPLRWVVTSTLDSLKDRLMDAPAGKANHRAWRGGLLEHTLKVAETAILVGPAFQAAGVDCEILTAAAILHDLHKVDEIRVGAGFEYVSDAQLFGHLYLGAKNAEDLCHHYGVEREAARRLVHCILSHHGQLEWEAVRLPCTPEALVLHHVDILVAHMEMVEEAQGSVNADGQTEYVKPLKRRLYFGPKVVVQICEDCSHMYEWQGRRACTDCGSTNTHPVDETPSPLFDEDDDQTQMGGAGSTGAPEDATGRPAVAPASPCGPDDKWGIPISDIPGFASGEADPPLCAPSGSNGVHSEHRPEHSEGIQDLEGSNAVPINPNPVLIIAPTQAVMPLSEFDNEPEPDPDADPMNDPFYAKMFGGEG